MVTICPTILAADEESFRRAVAAVKPLGLTLHVDVMDGVFVPEKTFAPVDTMHHLADGLPFDAHLMVAHPEHAIPTWVQGGAGRVYFHVEATDHGLMIHRATKAEGDRLGLVLNPDTPIEALEPYIGAIRHVMVMSVQPGRGGQQFDARAYDRIREIKRRWPNAVVAVDGGVKPENARSLAEAGADVLMVGSALTGAPDPAAALAAFKAALP